jgi:hypothetical protein
MNVMNLFPSPVEGNQEEKFNPKIALLMRRSVANLRAKDTANAISWHIYR